jgi:Tol biopolymer transport system component
MGDPSSVGPPSNKFPDDRLDSWKEIAAYLKRDVTTVQRWEKREGMPVHRHVHGKMGSVYASRTELDAWAHSRTLQAVQGNENAHFSPFSAGSQRPFRPKSSPLKWGQRLSQAMGEVFAIGKNSWLQRTASLWRNPIEGAIFHRVTDFDWAAQAAALSRDGQFVAFLSDRDGGMDVWVTQVGSGQLHNLTRGKAPELPNPLLRTLGFSPDSSLVTFWGRRANGSGGSDISIWAVPTMGGQPRPYLEGVSEFDWSPDGSRLVYHTPDPGDPLFVSDGSIRPGARPIFAAPAGNHCHFPLWAPDGSFIYYVQGVLPDKLSIWRIAPAGGSPERITLQDGRVTYPVLWNARTLMYLNCDPDGSGPWLYGVDVEHHVPHRLTFGPDRYTSLAATADGRRLAATLASPTRTLWRMGVSESGSEAPPPGRISLTTGPGFSPRVGPNFLLYISAASAGESIWKLSNGTVTELWTAQGALVLGGPAVSPDGREITFSARHNGQSFLYAMHADGTGVQVITSSLKLRGSPAWAPDGKSITAGADDHGVTHLFHLPLHGRSPQVLVQEYSIDPAWAPDGSFVVYTGPDIGTTFSVKAVTASGAAHNLPSLTLTRGARHLALLPGGNSLVFLRGEIHHKNVWLLDLATGIERQLTDVGPDFDIRDFDISPDGREIVLERAQEHSEIVLIDLPRG